MVLRAIILVVKDYLLMAVVEFLFLPLSIYDGDELVSSVLSLSRGLACCFVLTLLEQSWHTYQKNPQLSWRNTITQLSTKKETSRQVPGE